MRPLVALLLTALVTGFAGFGCYAPTVARERPYHPSDADLTITRVVHATVVLDFGTTRILADPWFSPSPPFGHRETIGIAPTALPSVRGIVVTHRHSDHFDRQMFADRTDKSVRVVVPRGLGEIVRQMGYEDVVEMVAWDQTQIGSVFVTAVPATHSARAVGYVFSRAGMRAYLAGDTRFDADQFRAVADAFGNLDVALLPVGGIRVFGRRLDMSAEQAVDAAEILGARRLIPYHYGLRGPFPFVLADDDPAREFARLAEIRDLPAPVVTLEPGESWHYYR